MHHVQLLVNSYEPYLYSYICLHLCKAVTCHVDEGTIDLTFDFQHLSVTFSLRANRVRPLVPKERDYEERNTVVEALLEAHHSTLGDEELCTFVSQNILLGEPEKKRKKDQKDLIMYEQKIVCFSSLKGF